MSEATKSKSKRQGDLRKYARDKHDKKNGDDEEEHMVELGHDSDWQQMEAKLDKIFACVENIDGRMGNVEKNQEDLADRLTEMERAIEHRDSEVEDMRKKMASIPDERDVKKLSDKLIELENRSRRNNIVIYNIPEQDEEKTEYMEDYVEEWLASFADMKRRPGTDRDIKIERAVRTASEPRKLGPRALLSPGCLTGAIGGTLLVKRRD